MKKTMITISAVALAAILAMTPVAINYANGTEDKTETTTMEKETATEANEGDVVDAASKEEKGDLDDLLLEKTVLDDEVVYVFSDPNGKVNKVMDSVWIEEGKEKEKEEAIADYDLPVDIQVKYYLDGKEINAKDLEGKNGHLKIVVNYDNKRAEERLINGKKETIYVPFVAATVTLFEKENADNVTVSKGRVIFDGSRYAVTGLAFPGLYDDLGEKLDENLEEATHKFTKADSLTIEADVKNCSYPGMYMIVTNSVFNDLKLDSTEKLDQLKEDMNKVNDAMDQLMDGSSKLYDGLGELKGGAGRLSNGVGDLANGLDTLSANSQALNDGARQVFTTLLSTATNELRAKGINCVDLTIDNYSAAIDSAIQQVSNTDPEAIAREKVVAAVNANEGKVKQAVTDAVSDEVSARVDEAVSSEVDAKVYDGVSSYVREQVEDGARAQVEDKVTEAVKAQVEQKVTEGVNAKKDEVETQVIAAVKQEVEKKVTANVEGQVEKQVEEAFAAKAGVTVEELMADPQNAAMIEQTVNAKMDSDDVKKIISANTDAQMETEEVKAVITEKTEETISGLIKTKTAEQMASEDVKNLIAAKTEENMDSDDVKALMEAKYDEAMQSDEVRKTMQEKRTEAMNSSEVTEAASAAYNENMNSEKVQNIIKEKTQEKMSELIEENYNSADVQNQIAAGHAQIESGIKALNDLKAQLDAYKSFYEGIAAYTNGVDKAAAGAETIKDSMPKMVNGINDLYNGEGELKDGIEKFNDEGVGKLNEIMEDNVEGLSERFDAISEVSKSYSTYSDEKGVSKSALKFIYKISGK